MAERRKQTAPENWPEKFLTAFRKNGNVSQAAKSARVARPTVYARLKSDPAFAEAMDDAQEEAADILEQTAWTRAVTGTLKPVFQGGEHVGDVRQYSDTLLICLLKANRPSKFIERSDITSAGQPVKVIGFEIVAPVAPQSDEEAVDGE